MKTRSAIIVGAMLCGGLLALTATTAAFAETTANNSGKQLENLQKTPQGASDAGYFVGSGAPVADAKVTRPRVRHHHR
jgi:hypothetical protein